MNICIIKEKDLGRLYTDLMISEMWEKSGDISILFLTFTYSLNIFTVFIIQSRRIIKTQK